MSVVKDKVIIVTGSGRGIGRAHADYLASQGAKVVVNDTGGDISGRGTEPSTAQKAVDEIVAAGGTAVADTHDVRHGAAEVVATAVEAFGTVDGVVTNAGIVNNAVVGEITPEQADLMMGVHVLGQLNVIQAAWPHLKGGGRVVTVCSAAVFGVGSAPLYCTAKAAIIGLTRALAADGAADNIRVNGILPLGYSRMADTQAGLADFMKRRFPPEQISPFVTALLSDDVPVTGELFGVGGGRAGRVFLGTVPGLVGFASPEEVLAKFDRAMDMTGSVDPTSMMGEMTFEYAQLGIEMSELGIDLDNLGTAESYR